MSHAVLKAPAELQSPLESHQGWDGHSKFLPNNVAQLQELFGVVGLPWKDDLEYVKDMTQPWAKGDHARPENPLTLSKEQKQRARELYGEMNLVDRVELPPGEYHGLILLGGLQSANVRCLDFLQNTLASGDVSLSAGAKIALWGGVREIDTEKEGPFLAASLGKLSANRPLRDAWLQAMVEAPNVKTESDGLRIGAYDKFGSIALRRVVESNDEQADGQPAVSHWDYDFKGHELVVLNTGAVQRPLGAPRHTTEACARQWAELYGSGLPAGGRVGFIASQPYGQRTTRVVQQVLDEEGYMGIQLIGAGPAAPDMLGDHLFRGEIARNIYEDFKTAA